MIITKTDPFTKEDVEKLKELFDVYVKTVIDVEKEICSAGMDRHSEGEKILVDSGSKQSNIWGGGIDLETNIVDFNSFINIRPNDGNNSSEILDEDVRKKYKKLMEYFFKEIL